MEAKDLRKGNIAKNDMRDIFKKGHVVMEARDIYEMAVDESGQVVDEMYKHFQPIPLTEEWLVKFGFEEKSYTDFGHTQREFCKKIDMEELILTQLAHRFELTMKDRFGDTVSLTNCKVDNVHQLQNLYYVLSGEELKI